MHYLVWLGALDWRQRKGQGPRDTHPPPGQRESEGGRRLVSAQWIEKFPRPSCPWRKLQSPGSEEGEGSCKLKILGEAPRTPVPCGQHHTVMA